MSGASAVLEAAVAEGLQILDDLRTEDSGTDGTKTKFLLNPVLVKNAKALIFLRTTKVGAGIGVKRGGGFVLTKLGPGQYSPPCFVTLTSLQAGILLGFEKVSTLCTSMTLRVVDSLKQGSHPVFGTDLSLQVYPLTGPNEATPDFFTDSDSVDLVVASVGKGLILDFSFTGGSIRVDSAKNESAYGKEVTTADILDGAVPVPAEVKALHRRVDDIGLLATR